MRALRLPSALAALALLSLTAVSSAQGALPRALTAHTLRCHQSYANYGPMGNLDHYGYLSSWTVRISTAGAYEAVGDDLKDGSGAVTYRAGQLRFTSGPFHDATAGWVLTGRYVRRGARLPHDWVKGRRYPLVLRSVHRKHADAAPPRRQTDALSFFHCR